MPRHAAQVEDALIFWGIAALLGAAIVAFTIAAQPLLLTFAGALFGTALRGAAGFVARRLGWQERWSLLACLGALAAIAVALGLWLVPNVVEQASELSARLAEAYRALREAAAGSRLGQRLLGGSISAGQQLGAIATRAAGVLASTFGALGSALYVLFVALFLAASPAPYRRGAVRLVPPARRERAGKILDELASTLRRWLLGRIVSMTAVGIATTVGLAIIGIPLPVTLGLLAGVLGFVPNIGPIVSAIPAVLIALTIGPVHAAYVAALYLAVNLGDGYGLTPWLQKRAVSVPPALILTGQVVFAALWGVLGVVFATPLLACAVVLVRELYVEEALESSSGSPTDRPPRSSRPERASDAPGTSEASARH